MLFFPFCSYRGKTLLLAWVAPHEMRSFMAAMSFLASVCARILSARRPYRAQSLHQRRRVRKEPRSLPLHSLPSGAEFFPATGDRFGYLLDTVVSGADC